MKNKNKIDEWQQSTGRTEQPDEKKSICNEEQTTDVMGK